MSEDLHLLFDGEKTADRTVALAHGAGAAMDTPFMNTFASALSQLGHRVARFEFPYMADRRTSGRKRPPNRLPVLIETWNRVIHELKCKRVVIGGKSMGGRIASLVADDAGVAGLVCLGYPFHPPGKPDRLRTEHLQTIRTPTLILQGTRDPLGNRDEVSSYRLARTIQVHWLEDGDHGFKPRKASGRTEHDNWQEAIEAIDQFLKDLDS